MVFIPAAFPMIGCAACSKCRCIRTSSDFISPRLITKKDKATVCVTPDARWIKKVISKLQSNKKKKRSADV
ncbi:unnamed protein product [Coregonus sp. 'balchen']|nr:unnamed protein product [Coregonus sp. 'balchen']